MSLLKRKTTKQKKISATFLAFVTPTLDPMGLSPEDPESETLIRACWTTWNAVVFADFVGRTDFLDALLDPARSSPASVILVKTWVERKRSRRFAADDRLIGDYKIRLIDGELRLWAEARDPYPKDQRAS